MSAPPYDSPATLSTTGYEDGLGRRLLQFDRESGTLLECLVLRPEFLPFEAALRQRIAACASFTDDRFARLNAIAPDDQGHLTVVSELADGDRLSDLIETRADHPREGDPAPTLDVALGFLLQVLPALSALHATAGFPHGALGPGRIVLRPTGQPVLLDYVFGQALERLHLSRERLWSELRIAARASTSPSRPDLAVDIGQASVCALSIVIGRSLLDADYPGGLAELVSEVTEIAQIRGSALFASALRRYLEKTLPLPGSRPYGSVNEAQAALGSIVRNGIGIDACRDALASYVVDAPVEPATAPKVVISALPGPRPALVDAIPVAGFELEAEMDITAALVETDYAVVAEVVAEDAQPAERISDVTVTAAATSGAVVGEAFVEETEEAVQLPIETVDRQEPAVVQTSTAGTIAGEAPIEETEEAVPLPIETVDRQEPAVVEASTAETIAGEAPIEETKEAAPPPIETADRQEPAVVEASTAETIAGEAPIVGEASIEETKEAAPLPIETVNRQEPAVVETPIAEPIVCEQHVEEPVARVERPEATPAESPRKWRVHKTRRDNLRSIVVPAIVTPPPAMPVFTLPPNAAGAPVASVYAAAAQTLWQPTPEGPMVAVSQPTRMTTIRLKTEPAGRPDSAEVPARRPDSVAVPARRPDSVAVPTWRGTLADERPQSSLHLTRKIAVAAIIVLVAAGAAGLAYLPERDRAAAAPRQLPAPAAPATAPAAAAVATPAAGSIVISTQPAGARVLLDGQMAGETPLTIDKVAPGRHTVTLMTATVSVRKSIRVEAGRALTLDVPVFSGWVAVFAPIPVEVSERGRLIGTTEQGRLMLAPGPHELTLTSREFGYTAVVSVDITAGEERAVTVEPRGTVNLNASPWAEVWIDGRKTGETPIANLQVPLGTREVLFKHPQFGERRMTLIVTASSPALLSIDFTKSQ